MEAGPSVFSFFVRTRLPCTSVVQRRKKPTQTFPSRLRSIFFTQPSGASVFGRRRPRPLMSKSNRLSESVSAVPGQGGGTGGRRRGICHDRTIHTFDSQGNAIGVGNWVGDFFAHRL